MTRLVTDRLVLRAARDDDLEALFRIFSDPRAMRYWSNLPHRSVDDTRPTLEKLKPGRGRPPGQPRTYFVFEHGGGVIGLGGIHAGTEIGFILHPDHWGQGYASEALRAVIDHVWTATDLPRITADADPRNRASVALMARLGFLVTGYARNTFSVGGEWSDSVYFALPRAGPTP